MLRDRIPMIIMKLGSHFPLRVVDWLVACVVLTWGVVCLNVGGETWYLPMYESLRLYASQAAWGWIAIALGSFRVMFLFINGAMRKSPHLRMIGAFLTAFMWLQLSFSMFQSEYNSIAATAIYPWLFLADIYNVYRAAQDAKLADYGAGLASGKIKDASNTAT